MAQELNARDRSSPPPAPKKTRRVFVVAAVLFALLLGWHFRGLVRGVLGRGQTVVQMFPLEGESTTLPIASRTASASVASATRASARTIDVGGRSRQWLLVEPTAVEAGKSYPLVFVFHGDGGDAFGYHDAFPFERATGADAFLVYPSGLGATWDLESLFGNHDIELVTTLIDHVAASHPIDKTRVFASGYSSGGFLANVIACQKPGVFRAIASNAGGAPYKQALVWSNGYPKCPGQEPTPMLALHGERDFAVTIDSGRFSAAYWAYVNGCKVDEMEPTGYAECRAYRGCPAGKGVGFCTISDLGHWVWDRSAEASWSFFQKQAPALR